jgi:lysyl-tRNA synthetase, class II
VAFTTDVQATTSLAMQEVRALRLHKVEEMRKKGIEPYAYGYKVNSTASLLHDKFQALANGHRDESCEVSVSGRILVRRVFGKLAFFELQDHTGSIQLYIDKKTLGDEFKNIISWTDGGKFTIRFSCIGLLIGQNTQAILLVPREP